MKEPVSKVFQIMYNQYNKNVHEVCMILADTYLHNTRGYQC